MPSYTYQLLPNFGTAKTGNAANVVAKVYDCNGTLQATVNSGWTEQLDAAGLSNTGAYRNTISLNTEWLPVEVRYTLTGSSGTFISEVVQNAPNNIGQVRPSPAYLTPNTSASLPMARNPRDLASLAWYQSGTGMTTDTGFTTPVSADGDNVKGWRDQSGNGRDATTAATPMRWDAVRGLVCQEYNTSTRITVPAGVAFSGQSFSAGFILEVNNQRRGYNGTGATDYKALFEAAGNNCNIILNRFGMLIVNDTVDHNGDGGLHVFSGTPVPSGSRVFLAVTSDASGCRAYVNGVQYQSLPYPLANNSVAGGTLANYAAGNDFPANASFADAFFTASTLTQLQVQSLLPYAYSRGVAPANHTNVVMDGDSIVAGYRTTLNRNPLIQAGFASGVEAENLGETSMTLATAVSEFATQVSPNFILGANNILLVEPGGNDLSQGDSAATVFARLQSYCSTATAAGWQVIACKLLPRVDVNVSAYNALIDSGFSGGTLSCIAVCDATVDAAFNNPTSSYTNGAIYNGDQIHLTNLGALIYGSYIRKAAYSVASKQLGRSVATSNVVGINGVSTNAIKTVNANLGTTQPMSFSGTGASAKVNANTVTNSDKTGYSLIGPVQAYALPLVTGSSSGSADAAFDGERANLTVNYPNGIPFAVNADLTGWTEMLWLAKSKATDADTAAVLAVKLSNPGSGADGLIYINGAAPTGGTSNTDASIGNLTIVPSTGGSTPSTSWTVNTKALGAAIPAGSYVWEVAFWVSGVKSTFLGTGVLNARQSAIASSSPL